MQSLHDTAVIILHFGSPEVTKTSLERLRRFSPHEDAPRVFVVENGPPSLWWPDDARSTVIRLPENRGYGAGNNAAIHAALDAGARFLVLVNNDVRVDRGWLEAMREAALAQNVGLVGAVLKETDGMVYGGGMLSWATLHTTLARSPKPSSSLAYIHGACLGITRACLERIGFLREDFFLYWEDVDYGIRARRAGFRLTVAQTPPLQHRPQSLQRDARRRQTYYLVRNALHCLGSDGPTAARTWARFCVPLRILHARATKKNEVLRALLDAQKGVFGPAPADL